MYADFHPRATTRANNQPTTAHYMIFLPTPAQKPPRAPTMGRCQTAIWRSAVPCRRRPDILMLFGRIFLHPGTPVWGPFGGGFPVNPTADNGPYLCYATPCSSSFLYWCRRRAHPYLAAMQVKLYTSTELC